MNPYLNEKVLHDHELDAEKGFSYGKPSSPTWHSLTLSLKPRAEQKLFFRERTKHQLDTQLALLLPSINPSKDCDLRTPLTLAMH